MASDVQSLARQGRCVIATVSVEKNVEEQILVPEDCLPGGPKENEFIAQCANCGQELVAFQNVFIHFAGLEKTRKQKPGKKSKVRVIQQWDCNSSTFIEKPNPWRTMPKDAKEKEARSDHSGKSATQKANAQISRILNQHASAIQQQQQQQQQQQILPAVAVDQSWVQWQSLGAAQPLWTDSINQWGGDGGQQPAWLWTSQQPQWLLNTDDNQQQQQWLTLNPEQIGWQVGPDGVLQAPQFIACVSGTTDAGLVQVNGVDQSETSSQASVTQSSSDNTAVKSEPTVMQAAVGSQMSVSSVGLLQQPLVTVQLWCPNGDQANGFTPSAETFMLPNGLSQAALSSTLSENSMYPSNSAINIMPLDGDIDFLDRSDLAKQIGSTLVRSQNSATGVVNALKKEETSNDVKSDPLLGRDIKIESQSLALPESTNPVQEQPKMKEESLELILARAEQSASDEKVHNAKLPVDTQSVNGLAEDKQNTSNDCEIKLEDASQLELADSQLSTNTPWSLETGWSTVLVAICTQHIMQYV